MPHDERMMSAKDIKMPAASSKKKPIKEAPLEGLEDLEGEEKEEDMVDSAEDREVDVAELLVDVSDDELLAELERRGLFGSLSKPEEEEVLDEEEEDSSSDLGL